jgi:DHA2 family multidrug resistance protein
MDTLEAGRAAMSLMGRSVIGQSTVIAFDTAFNAVALLFVIAAPVMIIVKVGLTRFAKSRAGQRPLKLITGSARQVKSPCTNSGKVREIGVADGETYDHHLLM